MANHMTSKSLSLRLADAISLGAGLLICVLSGLLVETVRFYAFPYVLELEGEPLPKAARFVFALPSGELFTRVYVFVILFTIPWGLLVVGFARAYPDEASLNRMCVISAHVLILVALASVMLSVVMVYPIVPRVLLMPGKEAPLSDAAICILAAFFVVFAFALFFVFRTAIRRGMRGQ